MFFCTTPALAWSSYNDVIDTIRKTKFYLGISAYFSDWDSKTKLVKQSDVTNQIATNYTSKFSSEYGVYAGTALPINLVLEIGYTSHELSLTAQDNAYMKSPLLSSINLHIKDFEQLVKTNEFSFKLGYEFSIFKKDFITFTPYLKANYLATKTTANFVEYIVASSNETFYELSNKESSFNLSYGASLSFSIDKNFMLTCGVEYKTLPDSKIVALDELGNLATYAKIESIKSLQFYGGFGLKF